MLLVMGLPFLFICIWSKNFFFVRQLKFMLCFTSSMNLNIIIWRRVFSVVQTLFIDQKTRGSYIPANENAYSTTAEHCSGGVLLKKKYWLHSVHRLLAFKYLRTFYEFFDVSNRRTSVDFIRRLLLCNKITNFKDKMINAVILVRCNKPNFILFYFIIRRHLTKKSFFFAL